MIGVTYNAKFSRLDAATGTNGRVTFAYNGGGNTDTDVEPSDATAAPSVTANPEFEPKRSNIKASTKSTSNTTDEKILGRRRK